ncbi:MAG: biotin/lipoyl-binding protein, partial [Salinivirgaceae bacterium]|nr:biotin/lipoyl-binding protein [Salinivirgaceae bacterium]
MKLRYLTVLSALAFLLFSCGNNSPEEQNVPETHELLTVAMQDYTMSTEYPASIQGNQDIKIIPRVEGYLQGVHVKEGDAVKAGQLLFRIDDATYRAAVESANANVQMMTAALNRAQLEYDGKKTLRQQEIVSDFELSLAES